VQLGVGPRAVHRRRPAVVGGRPLLLVRRREGLPGWPRTGGLPSASAPLAKAPLLIMPVLPTVPLALRI